MNKYIYTSIVALVLVSGLLLANREIQKVTSERSTPKPPSAAESRAELKRWEASPDGIQYKKWEASPEGKKVLAGAARIRKQVNASGSIEAVITSLSLPQGSRLGFGVMAMIDGEEYILSFGPLKSDEFQLLRRLEVNDKVVIRSQGVSWAPKYAYPIVSGSYVERDHQIIYQCAPRKGGC